ncbi:hypothetical protein F5X99DRAFT_49438 [Biscogniauxia marginata]|nr:hypothetical protein F5X99DRAFT_49438 [Biscogniauxia marginata]
MPARDARQSVLRPQLHPHNSLRDPYQIPSDSEIEDSAICNSTTKYGAIRGNHVRNQSYKNTSARSLYTAPNIYTQVHATPMVSRASPGQASAQRSLSRTPSRVPADTQVISPNSSSSNETPSPRTTPPLASTRASTAHSRTPVKIPAGAEIMSLLEPSRNKALPAPTASRRGLAATNMPVSHRRTPAQIPVDAEIISLSSTSSQSDDDEMNDDDGVDVDKLAVQLHPSTKGTEGCSRQSTTRYPSMMGKQNPSDFQKTSDSPAINVERKPWWNPWDWARRYRGIEFELNGPTVWFSDGPFKGYIISGPQEGSYMPGHQAPNDEVLAQAEKTAVLNEVHELWETSSEPSASEDIEQCNPMVDAEPTTGESCPSELNYASRSPAILHDPRDNSKSSTEQIPQASEREERIKRTQLYVLTGNPTNASSWNNCNTSLDFKEGSMLPGNLAPASTPARESSPLSTNSKSTSVLIARQLTVQCSPPPPSDQELATLKSSSHAPREIRPSKLHMQGEQFSYKDDERDQSSGEPSVGVPVRPHRVTTPARAREGVHDTPRRFEKPSVTHVGDNIAERRITRSMTGTPRPARPNYRVPGVEIDATATVRELPDDTLFKPPQGAPRLKQVNSNSKDETDARPKAGIMIELPAISPEQQAEYATIPSSETSSLDALYVPKSFDELNSTCASRSTQPSGSNEEALAFTLRESPSWLNSIAQIDSTHLSDSTEATRSKIGRKFKHMTVPSKRTCSPREKDPSFEPSNLDYMPRDERRSLVTDHTTECTMKAAATGQSKEAEPETSLADSKTCVSSSQSLGAPEIKTGQSGTLKTANQDSTAGVKHDESGLTQPYERSTTAIPLPPLFVAYAFAKTEKLPGYIASGSQRTLRSPEVLMNPISSPETPRLIDASNSHAVCSTIKRKLDVVVGNDMARGACGDYKQSPPSIESHTKKRKKKYKQDNSLSYNDDQEPAMTTSKEQGPARNQDQRDLANHKSQPKPTSGNSKDTGALCDQNGATNPRYRFVDHDGDRREPTGSGVDKASPTIGLTSNDTTMTPPIERSTNPRVYVRQGRRSYYLQRSSRQRRGRTDRAG